MIMKYLLQMHRLRRQAGLFFFLLLFPWENAIIYVSF